MLRLSVGCAVVALALLGPGCSQPAATQLIVIVDTDYAIPSELDQIQIDVQGPDGLHHVESETMPRTADLPYALSVVPQGSALGPVRIEARGLHAGVIIVSRVGRVMLVPQQSLMVRLDLLHACGVGVGPSCSDTQSCGEGGRCVTIDVAGVPFNGIPQHGADAGAPRDGGAGDGATNDAGNDAGIDAAFDAGPIPDTGPMPDAFTVGDGGHDAGRDAFVGGCTAASDCDDANPCTDDSCTAGHTCAHANNTASCGVTTCGPYGVCTSTGSVCSTTGNQSRTCTDHVCAGGTCGAPTRVEVAACTRTPAGTMCMAASCGAWSACNYRGDCTPATMQSRTCTDYACDATGGCAAGSPRTEMQACPQAPAGTDCARLTQCGTYACTAGGICAPTGGQCGGSQPYCCTDVPPYCAANSAQCFL